jgi:hypothetical protein
MAPTTPCSSTPRGAVDSLRVARSNRVGAERAGLGLAIVGTGGTSTVGAEDSETLLAPNDHRVFRDKNGRLGGESCV